MPWHANLSRQDLRSLMWLIVYPHRAYTLTQDSCTHYYYYGPLMGYPHKAYILTQHTCTHYYYGAPDGISTQSIHPDATNLYTLLPRPLMGYPHKAYTLTQQTCTHYYYFGAPYGISTQSIHPDATNLYTLLLLRAPYGISITHTVNLF